MDIRQLLCAGAAENASDIFLIAGSVPVRRLYGEIRSFEDQEILDNETLETFRNEIFGERQKAEFERTGAADFAWTAENGQRFRLNFYNCSTGSALAARPVGNGSQVDLGKLNLPAQLYKLAEAERGLILIAGSTGSGKSTTLAGIINYINRTFSKHILSVEDPIEFQHRNLRSLISQRELGRDTISFAEALRNAMRENPDVIVIGEMRDMETMQAAVTAALTGHLVISTVHTSDTLQAVERIVNLFPEDQRIRLAQDIGSSLVGIVAQRLLKRMDGSGMIPACEIMLGTPMVKKLISESRFEELDNALHEGAGSGMISFTRAVYKLFMEKIVSEAEAASNAGNPEEFRLLRKGMENGVDAFRNQYGSREEDGDNVIDMATLLYTSVRQKASDLILTVGCAPALRINGDVRHLNLPPLTPDDMQKLLLGIITPHQRIVFEDSRELDFALTVNLDLKKNNPELRSSRFRVNAFHQRGQIGVVARVVNSTIPAFGTLGLPSVLREWAAKKQGLVLVTGPTGSGKSTTLAAMLSFINDTRQAHVITIEDPIEYVYTNNRAVFEQREVGADTRAFAAALKYALREAPDVIMVGEMRDIETISSALTAAETGHLVLATIHTNSAPQTIDRIVDSFPSHQQNQIRQQLASALLGVISQRLMLRKDGTGRIGAYEIMAGTSPIRALIREGKTHLLYSSIETGAKDGMITLEKALDELYAAGKITYADSILYRNDAKPIQSF